jgi:hypothetical protein
VLGFSSSSTATLALGGGTAVLATNGTAINLQENNQANLHCVGVGPANDAGTYWNYNPATSGTTSLVNSVSGATSVTFSQTSSAINTGNNSANNALNGYVYNTSTTPVTGTIGGLTPGVNYNLYVMSNSNGANTRVAQFTITGGTVNGAISGGTAVGSNAVDVGYVPQLTSAYTLSTSGNTGLFTNITPNSNNQIIFSYVGVNTEADFSGFQLVPIVPYTSGVSITATASSTLDFSGALSATVSGSVNLTNGATLTLQNASAATLSGNIVTDGSSTALVPAAGGGATPVLTLGATTINVGGGGTLALPAVTFSPSGTTVTLNGSTGSGTLALNGAATVSTASTTLNVNAGQLHRAIARS